MTTFHDLLGTTEHTTPSEIKKRYKLLSHRLHPDKLGSSALMQLITSAYNEILQGNGNKTCESVSSDKLILTKKYAQKLKQELEIQRTKNVELEQQILDLRKSLNNETKNNKKITEQLKQEMAKTLIHPIATNENNQEKKSSRFKYGIVYSSIALNILLVVIVSVFINTEPVASVDEIKSINPSVNVIEKETIRLADKKERNVVTPEQVTPVDEIIAIALTDKVNQWQLFTSSNNKFYIAVRNQSGSYIVSNCDGQVYYYANLTQQRSHLSPNLAFMQHYQNFSVYRINYGMGSQKDHWLNSQGIKVNREYFTNLNFEQMQQELKSSCSI
ncbi:molecular chaperone DnaJ [Photobacterium leiognathi subsp. mandapamensis]|nr:molecular chaperone DnaJ [Photobacterium leiognathi subsp. mandapamensis]